MDFSKGSTLDADYIIAGGGPAGMTLAWILGEAGKSVILLEREKSLGGCHRVRRTTDGLFTEHGPRIYMSNAFTLKNVLERMGLDFDLMFTPYHFNFTQIGGDSIRSLKMNEIIALLGQFLCLIVNPKHGQNITVAEFMEEKGFSKKSQTYLDNICRLTDGAGAKRYTIFELLHTINQHAFHSIVQPNRPNDLGLIGQWERKLRSLKGVRILLNHQVETIEVSDYRKINGLKVIKENGESIMIKGHEYIMALPSQPMLTIMRESMLPEVKNAYGNWKDLVKWHQMSQYLVYLPVVFHWDQKLNLPEVWGFPTTDWGLVHVVLTDYMVFDHPLSKTVISTCISKAQALSHFLNKTPDQCSSEELIAEVLRQLRLSYPDLPKPTRGILSPGVSRDNSGYHWQTRDSAFILTTAGFLQDGEPQSQRLPNLYWVGTHNGHHKYHFTSIESAVSNAVSLAHRLLPSTVQKYQIKGSLTLIQVIYAVMIMLFAMFVLRFIKQKRP